MAKVDIPENLRTLFFEMLIAALSLELNRDEAASRVHEEVANRYSVHPDLTDEIEELHTASTEALADILKDIRNAEVGAREKFWETAKAFGYNDTEIGLMLALAS